MKNNQLIFKILFIFFFISPVFASLETYVVTQIEGKIITNYDIKKEYNYLSALNKEIEKLDNITGINIAKESLIREKIKEIEIKKYFDVNKINSNMLEKTIKNLYINLGIENTEEFEEYLDRYELNLDEIKEKFIIELFWNELIKQKFTNLINVNIDLLKEEINKKNFTNKKIKEFNLLEILFQVNTQSELNKKIQEINQSILENGFKNTATIYSVSNTAKLGGQIGWIDENKVSKIILDAINDLEIGEISSPINLPNGFLILKVENIKEKESIVDKEKILEDLVISEKQKQFDQFSLSYFNKIKLNTEINEQ
tara:strand:- start:120 stop:1058 length:939 start_codon:yes stop_codon:yes gene_type:complete